MSGFGWSCGGGGGEGWEQIKRGVWGSLVNLQTSLLPHYLNLGLQLGHTHLPTIKQTPTLAKNVFRALPSHFWMWVATWVCSGSRLLQPQHLMEEKF